MRIVIISSDQYPFFIDTVNKLADKGFEVHVFCSVRIGDNNRPYKLHNKVIFHDELLFRLNGDFSRYEMFRLPLTILNFRKILKRIQPDILHAFNLKWSGWIAAFSGFHPFVLTGLGSDILVEQGATKNFIFKFLRKIVINTADLITVVSEQMRKQVKEVRSDANIIKYYPGANREVFKKKNYNDAIINGIDFSGKEIILSPRFMKPIYRHDVVLNSFVEIAKKNEKAVLLFNKVGDIKYSKLINNKIKEYNLSNRVFFFSHLTIDEWVKLLNLSSIIISIPFSDGMPATVFEAISVGKKLVISDIVSMREIFRNDTNLVKFCRCKKEELAKIILDILYSKNNDDEPEALEVLFNNGFELLVKKYKSFYSKIK